MFQFILLNKTCKKNTIPINLWHFLEYFLHVHPLVDIDRYMQDIDKPPVCSTRAVVNERVLSQTFSGNHSLIVIAYANCSHSSFNHIAAFLISFLCLGHGLGLIST